MATRFYCPCCTYQTLAEQPPGSLATCPVCGWIDDTLQSVAADLAEGANPVSLNEARANFDTFGASSREALAKVRPPREDEPRKPPRKRRR